MFVSKEKETVLDSHKKKAQLTTEMLNSMDGVQCHEVRGAVYAFPRITLPKKAIEEAKVTSQALSKNARVSVDTPKGVKISFLLSNFELHVNITSARGTSTINVKNYQTFSEMFKIMNGDLRTAAKIKSTKL